MSRFARASPRFNFFVAVTINMDSYGGRIADQSAPPFYLLGKFPLIFNAASSTAMAPIRINRIVLIASHKPSGASGQKKKNTVWITPITASQNFLDLNKDKILLIFSLL